MKKSILILALAMLSASFSLQAGDRPVTIAQLPAKARQLIETHFADITVSYAKFDDDMFSKSYEVLFIDGTELEFRNNGDWKSIDCKKSTVPAAIVPEPITTFVGSHHAGSRIVEIERDRRDFEVKLDNGAELVFDLKHNFKHYE